MRPNYALERAGRALSKRAAGARTTHREQSEQAKMAGGREIKTKVKSIQSTRKVTRALEMVSASKIRKAQDRMKASRPYARLMRQVIGHVARANSEYQHPFLTVREQVKRVGYVVISSDRGLCGGLNSTLFRKLLAEIRQWQSQGVEVDVVAIGQRASSFFRRLKVNLVGSVSHLGEQPQVTRLIGVMKVMLDAYANGGIDRLLLCYNDFINTMTQRPTTDQLLPLELIVELGFKCAMALGYVYRQGLIHRDVKPKNIMITKAGVAKLADMGLARAVSDKEAAEAEQGKAYGTPYYISPEQIRGSLDVDFRCDIYGFGATFYHLVTGRVPFDAPNPSAVMHRHLKDKLTPPDHVNPKLSTGIGEVIEVCMAKNANERYQTTSDLLYDLECVARGEPPVQARKKFDIGKLADLDKPANNHNQDTVDVDAPETVAITSQPLFWAAIAGWAAALLMTALYLMK